MTELSNQYLDWVKSVVQKDLSADELDQVVKALALVAVDDEEQPKTGVEVLHELATHGMLSPFLDRSLVYERGTPSDPTMGDIIVAMVESPDTSQDTLLHYAGDYPEAFLNNPVLMLLLLERPDLFRDMHELRLLKFLQYAQMPANLMETMRAYASPAVLETIDLHIAIAGEANDDWPEQAQTLLMKMPIPADVDRVAIQEHLQLNTFPDWILELIRQHPDAKIQALLNSSYAPDPLRTITTHAEPVDRAGLAEADMSTRLHAAKSQNPEVLAALVEDESDHVRRAVAQNPATPLDVLNQIVEGEDREMRQALAINPNLTPELMEGLAKDYTWSSFRTRLNLAQHPDLTPEVLTLLALDQTVQVRSVALRHPKITPLIHDLALAQALTMAVYSDILILHVTAANHPATPFEHLSKITYSPYWQARYCLALNPSATPEILNILANDGNRLVRKAAQSRIN